MTKREGRARDRPDTVADSPSPVAENRYRDAAGPDPGPGRHDTITVGGLPGTGTSTLCRLLEQRLGIPYIYAGQLFREEAAKRGMDLEAFGRLCEADPSIDRALDDKQVQLLEAGNVILEGRLAGWLAHHHRLPAFKVWVTCDEEERIRRIVDRDGGTAADQAQRTQERQRSEARRYARYYGADLDDLGPYDLVIDSTSMQPGQVADAVLAAVDAVT